MFNENQNIQLQNSNSMDVENEQDLNDMANGLGDNEAIHKLENEMFYSNNDTVEKNNPEMNYKNSTHIKTGLKIENLSGKILNLSLNNQKWSQSPQNEALSEKLPDNFGEFNLKFHGDKSFLGESYKINNGNLTDFSPNMNQNEEKNFSQNLNIKDNNTKVKVGTEEIFEDKKKINGNNNLSSEKNIIGNNEKIKNNFEENNEKENQMTDNELLLNEGKNLEKDFYYDRDVSEKLNQTSEKRVSTKDNSSISKENYFMNCLNNNNGEELLEKDLEIIGQIMHNNNGNNFIPEEGFGTNRTLFNNNNYSINDSSPTQFSNNGNDD